MHKIDNDFRGLLILIWTVHRYTYTKKKVTNKRGKVGNSVAMIFVCNDVANDAEMSVVKWFCILKYRDESHSLNSVKVYDFREEINMR